MEPALAAYEVRDYTEAETLALALLDDPKLDRATAQTIRKLAEEAKRMQDSIASDLAAIETLATSALTLSASRTLFWTGLLPN